ncbi:hypothetical protein L9F63_014096, partial [Diploptera punctata]
IEIIVYVNIKTGKEQISFWRIEQLTLVSDDSLLVRFASLKNRETTDISGLSVKIIIPTSLPFSIEFRGQRLLWFNV